MAMTAARDPAHEFRQAMIAAGLEPPVSVEPGRFHRFPGAEKSATNRAGWCLFFDDCAGGVFGDFSTGISETWQAARRAFTDTERRNFARQVAEARQQAEVARAERQAEAAQRAARIWSEAEPCNGHAYLSTKAIKSDGVKLYRGALVIPIREASGALKSLQFIDATGGKKFLSGGAISGGYFSIGKPSGRIILCEGFADAATIHQATGDAVACAFSANNLRAAAEVLRAKFPDLEILVFADNDDAGLAAARDAALAVGGLLAVPDLKDAADLAAERGLGAVAACAASAAGVGAVGLSPKAAIERARSLLIREVEPGDDTYPLDALGPLAEVARAIAEGAQVRPAMAGQAVLSVAALLTARVANVRSLDGSVKPLSLYLLTVGLSGDGKDAADRPALAAVHDWQRERHRGGSDDHWLLSSDITAEGLRRSFKEGPAGQGVFSSEAGQILAGHAMSIDHRIKTAATLCGLFDRGHLSVVRAGEGRTERYGVRLSAHLLVQPAALGGTLADEGLAGIGFWPRFLLAWPPPLEPRVHRPWRPDTCPVVGAYWRRCRELLDAPAPDDCGTLPTIELDAAAESFVATFFEAMEREARRGGLRDVRPFALRATELLCRVAGVLTAWTGGLAIDADTARNAAGLVTASVDAWQIARDGRADPVPGLALALYEWLVSRGEPAATKDILRLAPSPLRSRSRRDEAIERLQEVGLVAVRGGEVAALGVDHASV